MGGKTIIQGASDYSLYDGDHVHVSAHARDKYTEEWSRNTALAAALLIISVQAYMLYFNPEKEFIDRILKITREQRELLLEYAIHMLEEADH